jgi:hypothetical protein
MKNINNMLSAPVNKLVKALGATVKLYSEIEAGKEVPDYFHRMCGFSQGLYDGHRDLIGVEDSVEDPDMVVLHELIHYTGTKQRLKRKWIINNALCIQDLPSELPTRAETQTEEATAQIGMLKLVLVLGFNPARFVDVTYNYLKTLPEADMNKADRDSDKAVDYLVKFIGMEKVA